MDLILIILGIFYISKGYLTLKKKIKVKDIPYYVENEISDVTKNEITEKYGKYYLTIGVVYTLISLMFLFIAIFLKYKIDILGISIITFCIALYYKLWLIKFIRYKTNDKFNN
ncbi:MAG: hypothetical protein PT934_00660 [Peptoniphilaceae bacterium]|uniref:hypothetical protein n=1 Tax=Parvimonas sp. TaxID=1944660 RepID=UPI0025EA05BE|nr:hypothetical protein [Parvimonas sp.]MCI5997169.1 hypothetical protein [Parvimonas sp.]MDD7764262.1 hypothetical protein [Peptoniphilaceae bacterium]MDY3051525.1 hypothetical protein [Parvimonas sp.]